MTTEAKPSAMRRKAGAGRPPPEIGRITAAKAVRIAVVQAAEDVAGLVVAAGLVDECRTTLTPFTEDLPDPALLALLEGPGGRYGLMVLDPQMLAALIEMQTTGRVVPRPAEPRAATRTDAIMCADFIDRLLEMIDERVAEAELDVAPAITGFRYALALAERRAIAMTLEDVPYRAFRFELDLGRGAKTGAVQILLPFDPPGQRRTGGAEAAAFSAALRAQVLETEAVLVATLIRRQLSLAEVAMLEVGSVLTLPRKALSELTLEALDGTVVARGRLGQQNGHRAVRLSFAEGGADAATGLTAAPAPVGIAATPPPSPDRRRPDPPAPDGAGRGDRETAGTGGPAPDPGGRGEAGVSGAAGADGTRGNGGDLGPPGG